MPAALSIFWVVRGPRTCYHSLKKHLLGTCCVLDSVLGMKDSLVGKRKQQKSSQPELLSLWVHIAGCTEVGMGMCHL